MKNCVKSSTSYSELDLVSRKKKISSTEFNRQSHHKLQIPGSIPLKSLLETSSLEIKLCSSHQRCSIKKFVLKNLQNSQENTCVGVSGLVNMQTSDLIFKNSFFMEYFRVTAKFMVNVTE